MGQISFARLGAANAQRHRVTIHGEAVVDGQHTLYLIAEANDRTRLEEFLEPFAMAGTVEVWPAPDCAAVEGGGCETAQLSPLPAR